MTGFVSVRTWYCGVILCVAGLACTLAWSSSSPVFAQQPATGPAAPSTAASPGAAAQMSFPPVGDLNQVMRGILFPSSNILFDVQTQDPGARKPVVAGDTSNVTTRYGNVYGPWVVVDIAAIALAESAPLLMTPGRRCENGKPVPVDRPDWQQYVRGLVDAGRAAYKAAQTRNQETVSEATNVVAEACLNCHQVFRRGGAARCSAPTAP